MIVLTIFFSNITEATLWFGILVIMIILYLALGRFSKIIPTIFHVKEIIIGYAKVFPNIWDLVYMLILVTITTRITTLKVPINISQEYTQIGVILTLLVAAMTDIISMAISKEESIRSEKFKDQSHAQKIEAAHDIVRIGIFEILIGFVDLIFIFLLGSFGEVLSEILRFVIYWLFYLFSFNVFALMHKLYLLYSEQYKE